MPSFLDPQTIILTGGLIAVGVIIFAECGLLIGFFLPGDTLLFMAGFLASQNVVGLDLGVESQEQAIAQFGAMRNLDYVQGNILAPPFKPRQFDYGMSLGVLHHTPNTHLIPGTASAEHLEENIAVGGIVLDAATLAALDTIPVRSMSVPLG